MKPGVIIGLVIIVAAMTYGAYAFKKSLVAYVPFKEAMTASSDQGAVQIIGALVPGQTRYDSSAGTLDFEIKESGTGDVMPVVYKSAKPDNFDAAAKVTAIGHYDSASQAFEADQLLVKCPSKYADQKPTERQYGSST